MKQAIKTTLGNILGWLVIPAVVIYGYYYGNSACESITIFYMWIMFILELVITVVLLIVIGMLDGDTIFGSKDLKDKKKIESILKWDKKLNSKWYKFQTSMSSVLYTSLAVLIASTGSIWTAIVFGITFVFMKYIFLGLVKEIYKVIVPKVKKAADLLHTEELLDLVANGTNKTEASRPDTEASK